MGGVAQCIHPEHFFGGAGVCDSNPRSLPPSFSWYNVDYLICVLPLDRSEAIATLKQHKAELMRLGSTLRARRES